MAVRVVAGTGDLARVVDVDPGLQDVGEAEPVRGPQFLDIGEFIGRRIVVMGETRRRRPPGFRR